MLDTFVSGRPPKPPCLASMLQFQTWSSFGETFDSQILLHFTERKERDMAAQFQRLREQVSQAAFCLNPFRALWALYLGPRRLGSYLILNLFAS